MVDRFTQWPKLKPSHCLTSLLKASSLTSLSAPGFLASVCRAPSPLMVDGSLSRPYSLPSPICMVPNALLPITYQPTAWLNDFYANLKKAALCASTNPQRWIEHLPLVLLGIHCSVKSDFNSSAAEMVYGSILLLFSLTFVITYNYTSLHSNACILCIAGS
eukprot:scpid101713/ scgid35343/ 